MAQVALMKLDKNWVTAEEAIIKATKATFTFSADKTYEFQFREGDGPALFLEPQDEPMPGDVDGFQTDMKGLVTVQYKPGSNLLYVRASATHCTVNVSLLGE